MPVSRRTRPTVREELAFQQAGYRLIAGIDEAGRGPLAGPVMAAAVILPDSWLRDSPECVNGPLTDTGPQHQTLVNDSKVLTVRQRALLYDAIVAEAVAWGVGMVEAQVIDQIGIAPATRLAMRRAVAALRRRPDALLVDAIDLSDVGLPCKPVIDGDARCRSIAAASIVAKVTRDRHMEEMDRRYPGYGFARHKGYGTREHLQRLREMGPSPIHRRTFAPLRITLPGFERL